MMASISSETRPRLARGVRLAEDRVRGGWNLLAPERVLTANATAVEVLRLCDGSRSFGDIVGLLAEKFSAEPARIEGEAGALLSDLRAKRMVEL